MTEVQLQQAFLHLSSFPTDNGELIGENHPLQTIYDFRPAVRQLPGVQGTWVDQDESGDFDPLGNAVCSPISSAKKRRRVIQEKDQVDEPGAKKQKLLTWNIGRKNGFACAVTLTLKSKNGIKLLRKLGNLTDNWPQPPEHKEQNFTELNLDYVQPQRLRVREQGESNALPPSQMGLDHECPSIADVAMGHPAARGCKGCFELGLLCTLLEEGAVYPCHACAEEENDCELIVQPTYKRACESCRQRRIVCSYRITEDHSEACHECQRSQAQCIAGPLSGRMRTGPSLDQKIPTPPFTYSVSAERSFKSCTECRLAKKRCSLLTDPGYNDCVRCKSLGQRCTFKAIKIKSKAVKSSKKSKNSKKCKSSNQLVIIQVPNVDDDRLASSRSLDLHPRDRMEALRDDSHETKRVVEIINDEAYFDECVSSSGKQTTPLTAFTKTIRTRLAHPIKFNHEVPDNGSTPCHWCEDEIYGLIGLSEVQVKVIDYQDGQGYIEISGGHVGEGCEPSRMCQLCTLERLLTSACRDHALEPIKGMDAEAFDYDSVLDWLQPKTCSSAPFEWCSICTNPAFYQCSKPSWTELEIDDEALACGLRLCVDCTSSLVEDHEGNLDEMIAAMEEEHESGGYGLRADVNFLRSDGLLMSQIHLV